MSYIKGIDDFRYDPSLVLHLPLYELDGASFMSKDAYGHLCAVTGAAWRPNGHYFDGSDDFITLPTNTPTGAKTIIAWVIPEEPVSRGPIFGTYVATIDKTQRKVYHYNGVANLYADTALTWGEPYCVGLVFDEEADKIYFYLNGEPDGSGNAPNFAAVTTFIGTYAAIHAWDYKGVMGEILLYNRVLAPLEIQHNYLATKWRYR